MRLLAHFAHAHPYAYWTLSGILMAAGIILYIVLLRRNRKKVGALVDLFDHGTAEFEENATEYLVRGRFHGRPASVSASRSLVSRVDLSIAGRFYLPFEARTSRWRWIYGIQILTNPLTLLWLLFSFQAVFERGFMAKLALVLVALVVVAGMMLNFIGKVSGYFGETSPSVFGVDLNGLGVRRFATYQPDRFHAAIEHSEIRKSFAHLFGSCRTDMLKVPGPVRANIKNGENWTFAVGATWLSRDKFLDKEIVHKTLTELSTLCADFDQFAPDPWLSGHSA